MTPWVSVHGNFDVHTDNNSQTYILTTTNLDAAGHCQIASLANYSFRLYYNLINSIWRQMPWYRVIIYETVRTKSNAVIEEYVGSAVIINMFTSVLPAPSISGQIYAEEQLKDPNIGEIKRLWKLQN